MTTTLTARRPEDLLAAVPVVLGFRPRTSLVMLTFGGRVPFHARVDLPSPDDPVPVAELAEELAEVLVSPCRRQEVAGVALVLYTGDAALAAAVVAVLVPAFLAEAIGVVDVLRADAGRWSRVPTRAGEAESEPAPYDDEGHPFAAEAVLEGRVVHGSREELAATVSRDPALCARWERLLQASASTPEADASDVGALVAGWVAARCGPDDAGAVRVLGEIRRSEVRDAALYAVTRETAADHLALWASLLRGAPDDQVPDVAALAAFCAWLSGDGALAWCALDRCFAVDPSHLLATCLAEALTRAVPPSAWEEAVAPPAHEGAGVRPSSRCFRGPRRGP